MTVADWALIISLGALGVTICNFVWNVWSKFIYPKPKVTASISFMTVYNGDGSTGPSCITLNATNFGPAEVILYAATAKEKKGNIGTLNPLQDFPLRTDHTLGPFSGGLPKKIDVGETFAAFFTVDNDWFGENNNLVRFGFQDTFGRNHWCSKKDVSRLKKSLLENTANN